MQHGLRDFEAPDHAAGVGLDELAAEIGESHEPQGVFDAALALGAGDAVELAGEIEIFPAGEASVGGKHLRHVADSAADLGGSFDDVEAGHRGGSFGRLEHGGEHLDRGGLAGAVWSQQAEDRSVGHVQGDVIGGNQVAEGAGEPERLDSERFAARIEGVAVVHGGGVGDRAIGRWHG